MQRYSHSHTVASFADAWIETDSLKFFVSLVSVASFADAWIETNDEGRRYIRPSVASFADAWIETIRTDIDRVDDRSYLIEVRGLKRQQPGRCSTDSRRTL